MASVEAHRKNIYRPPYYVHKWWARRTGSVFRGLLLDLILPPDADVMSAYYEAHDFSDTVILDPFMGGGTTVGEALRLKCRVVGCDLNPVAWFLVNQAMRRVPVADLIEAFEGVQSRAAEAITAMYASTCDSCGLGASAQYVSWVKTVPCRGCEAPAPLNLSHVVMRDMASPGAGLVGCPACRHPFWVPNVGEDVHCPECTFEFCPNTKRTRNTHYRCDACGYEEAIAERLRGAAGPPAHEMRYVVVWCDLCGKGFQRAKRADREAYERLAARARKEFDRLSVPKEEIRPGFNTNQMRRYGYRYWHELFNERQLLGLSALFEAIRAVENPAARDVLTLLGSASLELNSMFCGAKGLGTGAVRHVFAHHAFIPPKEPLEANLWGANRSSGGFSTLFRERLLRARAWADAPVERRFTGRHAEKVPIRGERLEGVPASSFQELADGTANMLLLNRSSEFIPEVPDGSIDFVVTDPPFGDNVMYSELSDFFYVWLRQSLKDEYPGFTSNHVEDDREAVINPGRGRDGAFYEEVVGSVFAEATRKLKREGRLAFTFHYGGEDAWSAIEGAITVAGLVVERWWPVFSEMTSGVPIQGKKHSNGHIDIVFVCGRRGEVRAPIQQATPAELAESLGARVPLVDADHRALQRAFAIQARSWSSEDVEAVEASAA